MTPSWVGSSRPTHDGVPRDDAPALTVSRSADRTGVARTPTPTFRFGQLVATPVTLAALVAAGDRGEVGAADPGHNNRAVWDGTRIISAYLIGGERFCVVTEASGSSTSILGTSE